MGRAAASSTGTSPDTFDTIPVVDLQGWSAVGANHAAFADHVVDICHRIGFFSLVGHGLEPELRDSYFAARRAFFSLPDDAKAGIDQAASPHFRGWERVGSELTDNRPDIREQLDLASEHPARTPHTDPPYLRLDGPNQWPGEQLVPGFRTVVTTMLAEMERIGIELLRVLSTGLGLRREHLVDSLGERRCR